MKTLFRILGTAAAVAVTGAAIVVLVSCYRTKEAQGGDAEGVLQFFGMRCDEGYVFFSCFHS